jgi:serine/threonine-protein kinase RsbW
MDTPGRSIDAAGADFVRVVVADARTVGRVRSEFAQWLRGHFALGEERTSDVVLAVNEALANAAEFAYAGVTEPGTVAIEAHHSVASARLVVVVTDHGAWHDEDTSQRSHTRGRGIPLMRALSDVATIEPSPGGTRVALRFDDCAAVSDRPGAMSDA